MESKSSSTQQIFSIGHSTHKLSTFIKLLELYQITAIADVRSSPYSAFKPEFNREGIQQCLQLENIAYVYLGNELGGRTNDLNCYNDAGHIDYDLLAKTPLFEKGVSRLWKGTSRHRIAMMCAEKDPLDCHRALLVGRALQAWDVDVMHILADGRLESHLAAMSRLIEEENVGNDLFGRLQSRDELVREAVTSRAKHVGYTRNGTDNKPEGV